MAYDSENDLLYVLSAKRGQFFDFLTYNEDGSLIDSFELGIPPFSSSGIQFLPVGDHVVLEPSPLLLMLAGLGMVACFRLRRRRDR